HKQVFDGDRGPNTGGMGAYSPMSGLSSKQLDEITRNIFVQTVHALQKEGSVFSGLLYAGLMITSRGPYVLEFNCRFGDPETQAVLPRLKFDLLPILKSAADMKLAEVKTELEWDSRYSVCVIMSSGGYPGPYKVGQPISGLGTDLGPDVHVFHSGTRKRMGDVVTNGGRVLGVTGLGSTLAEARAKAYSGVNQISFKDAHFRTDIGRREKQ
ncbi:MAG: phosphoribosylglycinamide synthetase C domain-containing protein, partial [Candidatus Brocadiia bacterium]